MTDSSITGSSQTSREYRVWDRSIRLFHWINVFLVSLLVGLGLAILNSKALQVGDEGKILLKTLHSWAGYAFIANLLWRIFQGFFGSQYSRWSHVLPFRREYFKSLATYLRSLKTDPQKYLGHNPAARLVIALLLISMCLQAATGLVLAGTDLYLPPFGHEFKEQVMAAGEDHEKIANVKPGMKENLDPEGYKEMRAFREPFITIHEMNFFFMLTMIAIHILGVIVTEIKERNAIVSAMITGNKYFTEDPVDLTNE